MKTLLCLHKDATAAPLQPAITAAQVFDDRWNIKDTANMHEDQY